MHLAILLFIINLKTPICHLVLLVDLSTNLIVFNVLFIYILSYCVTKLCRYFYFFILFLTYNVTCQWPVSALSYNKLIIQYCDSDSIAYDSILSSSYQRMMFIFALLLQIEIKS